MKLEKRKTISRKWIRGGKELKRREKKNLSVVGNERCERKNCLTKYVEEETEGTLYTKNLPRVHFTSVLHISFVHLSVRE